VLVRRPIPQVVDDCLDQALLYRLTNHALGKKSLQHGRKKSENIKTHGTPEPFASLADDTGPSWRSRGQRPHPEKNSISVPDNIELIAPQGYIEFQGLLKYADKVITDSGGITLKETAEGPKLQAWGKTVEITPSMPPGLGEHTASVLESILGLDAAEIARLRDAGVIA